MTQVKVIHYQDKCIGCAACAGLCPTVFTMDMEIVKSKLIDGEQIEGTDTYTKIVEEDPMVDMLPSVCPAEAIEIE